MQGVCAGIAATRASRATCARSLCENFLRKMSAPRSLPQDPIGAFVQDRCMKISCARCLCQDLPGFCRSACAGSVYEDLLRKVFVSRSFMVL